MGKRFLVELLPEMRGKNGWKGGKRRMKKKVCIFLIILSICLPLCGCSNKHDTIEIYNKNASGFDNVNIEIKKGYFYDRHEKYIVDENTVAVIVYFTKQNTDSEWKNSLNDKAGEQE